MYVHIFPVHPRRKCVRSAAGWKVVLSLSWKPGGVTFLQI